MSLPLLRTVCLSASAFLLGASALAQDIGERPAEGVAEPTRILSQTDVERLRTAQGMTLQWIEWDERGDVEISVDERGVWRITGAQVTPAGASVRVDGVITEIGEDYFLLDGRVQITGTPDPDRTCDASRIWRFGATQRRAYFRLREFEWCDYLTDYIDIYFAPGLR